MCFFKRTELSWSNIFETSTLLNKCAIKKLCVRILSFQGTNFSSNTLKWKKKRTHRFSRKNVNKFLKCDASHRLCIAICKIVAKLETLSSDHYGGPQLSRQNQKPHGKNKIRHSKTKKPHGKNKNLMTKSNTHGKKQIPHSKSKYPRQTQSYFAFAVKYLVLLWGILFLPVRFLVLPWCFFFFCREVFGFAVMFLFLPRGFWFCRDSCGPP